MFKDKPLTWHFSVGNLIAAACCIFSLSSDAAEYVGAAQCKACHQQQDAQWKKSDHFRAMQIAGADTVEGDFSNQVLNFHGMASRFFVEQGQYFVETINANGEKETFPVRYTFGHQPLQQYLLEVGNGRLQAFDIAWDNREKEQGGQRWFHLQPDENITTEHPFFWQGYFQNWNSRCAQCHSTNLEKNYSAAAGRYETEWSDINVACEACHGPGSDHLAFAVKGSLNEENTGLLPMGRKTTWKFKPGEEIASPVSTSDAQEMNRCGGCHSRRMDIEKMSPGAEFHDQYRLQPLSPGLYFADGQIQDEVFVLGSFLQSKMYRQGVRCTDCHSPHTGKIKTEGNGLCAQCHMPEAFDTSQHHGHVSGAPGGFCVDCHMPERTYMGVDARRDHSFVVPRSNHAATGTPSACVACHQEKDAGWIDSYFKKHAKDQSGPRWFDKNYQARQLDILSVRSLSQSAVDPNLAPIVRATLIEQLANFPSRVTVETAQKSLTDIDPLVRRSAVASIAFLPAESRWSLLQPLLDDEVRSVRFEVAASLSDIVSQLPAADRPKVDVLLVEYRESLNLHLDSPTGRLSLANLEVRLGNYAEAQQQFEAAIEIAPGYIPALLNFADFQRMLGNDSAVETLLLKALAIAPDAAAAQHAYGLHLVRQGKVDNAMVYLETASTIATAMPRYSYVYAVALDSTGKVREALDVLVAADQRWPNQTDLLMTILLYAEKLGLEESYLPYLSRLSAIAPNSEEVRKRVLKYRN